MSKKKINIAPGANPFDKSKTAAENMFIPSSNNKPADKNSLLDKDDENIVVDTVGYVEQQIQQIQHVQQANQENPPQKKTPRSFPGKQHVHLIIPDRQANMIKQLAKMAGISVNQFMSQSIDTLYEEHWKPVVEVLEQNRHKLGLDKKDQKTDKNLFT